jgi:FkbM family methyltransferase
MISYEEFKAKAPDALKAYDKAEFTAEVSLRGILTKFFICNLLTAWRASTILTKEPHTIVWLDSLTEADVLYDIGANIGIYSVYAAKVRGCRVFSFEPEASNYFVLNRNILLNEIDDKCSSYSIAVSNKNTLGYLYMSNMRIGDANHSAGLPVRFDLSDMKYRFKQGVSMMTLDNITKSFNLPSPTHLKVDVDGLEHLVIAGAVEAITDKTLKSILIELNTNLPDHQDIITKLKRNNFTYSEEQVNLVTKKQGWNKGLAEFIFTRETP